MSVSNSVYPNVAVGGYAIFFRPDGVFDPRPCVVFDVSGNLSPEQQLKAVAVEFKTASDAAKSVAEQAMTEVKNLGKVTTETGAKADQALTKFNDLSAVVTEIEQRISRSGGAPEAAKTMGEQLVEDPRVSEFMAQKARGRSVGVALKNITLATTTQGNVTSVGTSLVPADRQGMVLLPDRRMVVRDLLTPGRTGSNAIEFPVEAGFTNAAAMVAEGNTKPKSDITFTMKNVPVRTLAHIMKASRQAMDDAPMLASMVDGRLRFGLMFVEEQQFLYGDGTGQNILGLIPQATPYAAPITVTGATNIDVLRLAALQALIALYPTTGYVLHPNDWARIELTKDTQGRYLFSNPQGVATPTMWGLPVVTTQAIAATTFLTGAFKMGAQIFDRLDAEVLLSTENVDDFERNMMTIRGEERLALAVYRPASFVTGTLPGT